MPPYEVLDPILEGFIEDDLSVDQIEARGFDRKTVGRILDMVKRNEYKRRQAPPGVRVSGRAFGRDWRYPITSGYKSRSGVQKGGCTIGDQYGHGRQRVSQIHRRISWWHLISGPLEPLFPSSDDNQQRV